MIRKIVLAMGWMIALGASACSPAKPADPATPEAGGSDHREIKVEKCDDTGQKDGAGNPVCSEGCVWDPAANGCKIERPIVIQCLDARLHWDAAAGKCIAPLPGSGP